ncbi:conserved hypothetical protein [Desulfosarcina cetonica]|uniref:hypothetical protein n=1 Tax=Desulfosarcina cetonica TaxID=90730 RepID=UPI0006D1F1A1|nr:hypothetical protein [Desulfosarcina cetonica]VTR71447.1 conserved hypothetical protein [Desulfosarcina cetonica]
MKITQKAILVGVAALVMGVFVAYVHYSSNDPHPGVPVKQAHEENIFLHPVSGKVSEASPISNSDTDVVGQPQIADDIPKTETGYIPPENSWARIDPIRLAQAELELVNNQIYEDVARDTLPILSLQTHNPVWQLEYEASHPELADGATAAQKQGTLPAQESGEFGNIQPAEGEIWLRIPVDHSTEYRDIMAQNADLYRTETGYSGTVTVTLWVGGRVYHRQQYE